MSRAARLFVPRSHRLFVAFDDSAAAAAGLAGLEPAERQDAWVFEGPEGARELDPGSAGGLARTFSWVFSHNVEMLWNMSRMVEAGKVLVALPAARLRVADALSQVLRPRGAQVLAYAAHWNFVPVSSS